LNSEVALVEYGGSGVRATTRSGSVHVADALIVATSSGPVARQRLEFSPPLPERQLESTIDMHLQPYVRRRRQAGPRRSMLAI
jgi:hypothetical protein